VRFRAPLQRALIFTAVFARRMQIKIQEHFKFVLTRCLHQGRVVAEYPTGVATHPTFKPEFLRKTTTT
jgi:hypothetical protein